MAQPTEKEILEAVREVQDPELNLSVVDMGLIYKIEVDNDRKRVVVTMTLTSMACPMGPQLRAAVHSAVIKLEGIEDVYVELVFDPPWDPRTMASEDVKMDLGLD